MQRDRELAIKEQLLLVQLAREENKANMGSSRASSSRMSGSEVGHVMRTGRYRNPDHRDAIADALPTVTPGGRDAKGVVAVWSDCLLYTSPSPRDRSLSRMPSSA